MFSCSLRGNLRVAHCKDAGDKSFSADDLLTLFWVLPNPLWYCQPLFGNCQTLSGTAKPFAAIWNQLCSGNAAWRRGCSRDCLDNCRCVEQVSFSNCNLPIPLQLQRKHLLASASTRVSPASIALVISWHMHPTIAAVALLSAPPLRGSIYPEAPDLLR